MPTSCAPSVRPATRSTARRIRETISGTLHRFDRPSELTTRFRMLPPAEPSAKLAVDARGCNPRPMPVSYCSNKFGLNPASFLSKPREVAYEEFWTVARRDRTCANDTCFGGLRCAKGSDLRSCADDQRRRLARHRSQQLHRFPSEEHAGNPCRQRCPVSQCVDDGTVGFVSRPAGSDDGRTSKSTGVFYDDSYDRSLFAPRSTGADCSGPPCAETVYAENIDKDLTNVTAGGTLGDLFSQMTPASCRKPWPAASACRSSLMSSST
jgi:hypothetical protein